MTTKFEHLIINYPLTRHNNFVVKNTLINIHQTPDQSNLLRVKPHSMDRILKSQRIESMRKMMLMQEQLFKHQVEELHRLYNLQKKLMQEAENGLKQQQKEKTATNSDQFAIRNQIPTEYKQSYQEMNARKDDPNGVISGSNISAENARRPMNFDLEMGGESTPSSSMHPCEEEMKKVDDDVEVELTLSIGHCTRKQRSEMREMEESDDRSPRNDQVLEAASSSSSVNNRPHWLMQDLSLNNTT